MNIQSSAEFMSSTEAVATALAMYESIRALVALRGIVQFVLLLASAPYASGSDSPTAHSTEATQHDDTLGDVKDVADSVLLALLSMACASSH